METDAIMEAAKRAVFENSPEDRASREEDDSHLFVFELVEICN